MAGLDLNLNWADETEEAPPASERRRRRPAPHAAAAPAPVGGAPRSIFERLGPAAGAQQTPPASAQAPRPRAPQPTVRGCGACARTAIIRQPSIRHTAIRHTAPLCSVLTALPARAPSDAGLDLDLGPEVDWRLSRVRQEEERSKPARQRTPQQHSGGGRHAADVAPRRVVRHAAAARRACVERALRSSDCRPRAHSSLLSTLRTTQAMTTPANAAELAVSRFAGRLVLPGAVPETVARSPQKAAAAPSTPAPRVTAATSPAPASAGGFVVRVTASGERSVQRTPPPAPQPAAAAHTPPPPPPRAAVQSAVPQPRTAAAAAAAPLPPPASASLSWRFRDPQGAVHGPHNAGELIAWYSAGYYGDTLPLQRVGSAAWVPLRDALPELKAAAAAALAAAGKAPQRAAGAAAKDSGKQAAAAKTPVAKGKQEASASPSASPAAAVESGWDEEETLAAQKLFGAPACSSQGSRTPRTGCMCA
jgi:hypothetical protein